MPTVSAQRRRNPSAESTAARGELPRSQHGDVGDYLRAAEAARDVAGGVHRAGRPGGRARARCIRCSASPRCSASRSAPAPSGALNMWYDADIDALMTRTARRPIPPGRMQPGEALAFGLTLSALRRCWCSASLVNWLAAALLAFTIFFYVVDLHDVAEALDAAEHRDRRRRRRLPADDRLGGGDRLAVARAGAAVPDHLLLDAAAFLGAGAVSAPTITPAPACRCCRWSPAMPRRGGRSCSIRCVLVPLGIAPWALGFAGVLYGVPRPAARRDHAGAGLARAARERRRGERAQPAACSPSRSSICSLLFARAPGRARMGRADRPADGVTRRNAMTQSPQATTESCSPRRRSAAGVRARSRIALALARWSCCST